MRNLSHLIPTTMVVESSVLEPLSLINWGAHFFRVTWGAVSTIIVSEVISGATGEQKRTSRVFLFKGILILCDDFLFTVKFKGSMSELLHAVCMFEDLLVLAGNPRDASPKDPDSYCGWTKPISHHFETTGNHCLLVFTGESSFQGFLGGAKWISSIHSLSPDSRRLLAGRA